MKTNETFIRINKETKEELLNITETEHRKSMSKMIQELIEMYKKMKTGGVEHGEC